MRALFVLCMALSLVPAEAVAQENILIMKMDHQAFDELSTKGIHGLDKSTQNAIAALSQGKGCPNCITGTIDPSQPLLNSVPKIDMYKEMHCHTDKQTGILVCNGETVSLPSEITEDSITKFLAATTNGQ